MSPDYLLRQAEKLLRELEEERQRMAPPPRVICLYDPETGEYLPGHEPDPHAQYILRLPKKNKLPGDEPYKD